MDMRQKCSCWNVGAVNNTVSEYCYDNGTFFCDHEKAFELFKKVAENEANS
ncbi:hypothetical protein Glove_350g42 [Diversispora epigaea]|uniref:Uncharacterized protein n=1 Tax=Diversispora epigaea TaxID=1348612 RepID=A0A397HG09_9GLOM|nr:hypothetical protein Glove_350g42 [Diversispora epigaea]